jgi:outer membrane protein assembly factor BamB
MKPFRAAASLAVLLAFAPPFFVSTTSRAAEPTQDVLTYHANAARSGNFVIPNLTFDRARAAHPDNGFKASIEGHVYAQPLFWRGNGGNGIVLVATESNNVYALDGATGKTVWQRALGRPASRGALPCGNIDPLGITGTPAIDPRGPALYLDAMVQGSGGPTHQLFGLSLRDGSVLPGWPIDVAGALRAQGLDFAPRNQNDRGAQLIMADTVYVPYGGHYGDCARYHGWVIGAKLDGSHALTSWHVPAQAGGIWAPAGISSDGTSLYVATGNTMETRQWAAGEAVIRLPLDLKFSNQPRDYFAPTDWRALDDRDADLGGVAPVEFAAGGVPLVLTLGKDGKAYLMDRSNLGGIGGALAQSEVSPRAIRTAVAVYPLGDAAAIAFEGAGSSCPAGSAGKGLTVLRVTGKPPAIATAWCAAVDGRGAPIVTTTDDSSNPIVWMLGAEGDDRLYAFRGDNGEKLFTSAPMKGLRHFETLIATPQRLYIAGDNAVYAFAF